MRVADAVAPSPPPPRATAVPGVIEWFFPLLAAAVILSFIAITPADADLWGHLTFGKDIVRTSSLPLEDTYSFTSDRPWINHEWLAEALMWGAYATGGAPALVALKLLLACLVALALLASWRWRAFPAVWRDALLAVTALGAWPQLQSIRPQAFSLALFAWLLLSLDRARHGRLRWLLGVPPMFAVWVNLHGGWVVGAAALVVFTACVLLDRSGPRRVKAAFAGTAAAALAATLCNPYGTAMLSFLADTVGPNRADIIEWHALGGMGAFIVGLWALPASLTAMVLWRKPRLPAASLLTVVMLAVGSLRVARLVGFFAIAVAVLLVPHLRDHARPADGAHRRRRSVGAAVAVCVVASACAITLFGRHISADGAWLPEPHAVAFIRTAGLRGRMLTWFDYGEYAIWHLAPGTRVSIDGRRETVYSEKVRAIHARIYADNAGAIDDVARLRPDYIWLPRICPTVPTLEANGWHRAFDGPRSIILTRSEPGTVVRVTGPIAPRWFPGP